VQNVKDHQRESINYLDVSVFNATEDSITQDIMDSAADILALAPELKTIIIGDIHSNDFYFDTTNEGEVQIIEL